jgi:hypothetical protein
VAPVRHASTGPGRDVRHAALRQHLAETHQAILDKEQQVANLDKLIEELDEREKTGNLSNRAKKTRTSHQKRREQLQQEISMLRASYAFQHEMTTLQGTQQQQSGRRNLDGQLQEVDDRERGDDQRLVKALEALVNLSGKDKSNAETIDYDRRGPREPSGPLIVTEFFSGDTPEERVRLRRFLRGAAMSMGGQGVFEHRMARRLPEYLKGSAHKACLARLYNMQIPEKERYSWVAMRKHLQERVAGDQRGGSAALLRALLDRCWSGEEHPATHNADFERDLMEYRDITEEAGDDVEKVDRSSLDWYCGSIPGYYSSQIMDQTTLNNAMVKVVGIFCALNKNKKVPARPVASTDVREVNSGEEEPWSDEVGVNATDADVLRGARKNPDASDGSVRSMRRLKSRQPLTMEETIAAVVQKEVKAAQEENDQRNQQRLRTFCGEVRSMLNQTGAGSGSGGNGGHGGSNKRKQKRPRTRFDGGRWAEPNECLVCYSKEHRADVHTSEEREKALGPLASKRKNGGAGGH